MPQKKSNATIYIIFGTIVFIFMLLIAGGYAYYTDIPYNYNMFQALDLTLTDIAKFRFHMGFSKHYQICYMYISIIYILFVLAFMADQEKYRRDAAGVEAGSAKWNDDLDGFSKKYAEPFGKKSNNDNNNMILSQHTLISINDMKTHKNNNAVVVGPAGKGKSRFFMKPNILQANCSYVVTDPSGELLDTLGKEMEYQGYEVKVFNIVNMGYSNQYNPFYYINEPKDVGVVVDCFLKNTTPPEESSSDPFWEKSETALLTAILFFLKDFADEDCRNFRTVLQLVQYMQLEENATKEQETKLDKLFSGKAVLIKREYVELKNKQEIKARCEALQGSLALENYQTFKLGGAKTLKSVLMSAAVRLNPFLVPEIANLTMIDTLGMDNIGDKKTIVFIIIPQANKTYNFLASMLFAQTFEALYFKAGKRNEGSANESGLRYKYHIRFLMDEYANIGNIPDFPNKISTMRKYNMSATVVLQSIAQIKQMHKDDYETILSNCDAQVLLGANDITTAEYYMKLMGKGTISSRSVGYSGGLNKKPGSNINLSQQGRDLMTIDEIRSMPFEKCIVLVSGEDPIYDDKYKLEKHPRYEFTGDGKGEHYNLMDSTKFKNFTSEILTNLELASEESEEAKNTISTPENINKMNISNSGDPEKPESYIGNIYDADRKDTIKCITNMKKEIESSFNSELEKDIFDIICVHCYTTDPRMMPVFLKQFSQKAEERKKQLILFCKDINDANKTMGYFFDKDGSIGDKLRKMDKGKIEPLSNENDTDIDEEKENIIYKITGIIFQSKEEYDKFAKQINADEPEENDMSEFMDNFEDLMI